MLTCSKITQGRQGSAGCLLKRLVSAARIGRLLNCTSGPEHPEEKVHFVSCSFLSCALLTRVREMQPKWPKISWFFLEKTLQDSPYAEILFTGQKRQAVRKAFQPAFANFIFSALEGAVQSGNTCCEKRKCIKNCELLFLPVCSHYLCSIILYLYCLDISLLPGDLCCFNLIIFKTFCVEQLHTEQFYPAEREGVQIKFSLYCGLEEWREVTPHLPMLYKGLFPVGMVTDEEWASNNLLRRKLVSEK